MQLPSILMPTTTPNAKRGPNQAESAKGSPNLCCFLLCVFSSRLFWTLAGGRVVEVLEVMTSEPHRGAIENLPAICLADPKDMAP